MAGSWGDELSFLYIEIAFLYSYASYFPLANQKIWRVSADCVRISIAHLPTAFTLACSLFYVYMLTSFLKTYLPPFLSQQRGPQEARRSLRDPSLPSLIFFFAVLMVFPQACTSAYYALAVARLVPPTGYFLYGQ